MFTLDAVYRVKAGFIMVLIRTVKSWQLAFMSNTEETKSIYANLAIQVARSLR